MKISVHAGHNPDGKIACGATGLIKESTQARKVTKYVARYLKLAGHTVYNDTVDNGTSQNDVINKLVSKINAHGVDLAVSIHFNSGAGDTKGNGVTTGTEVLVYNLNQPPKDVAENIVKQIAKLGFKNRGVKQRTDLGVLRSTKVPALLVECCFVDDKDDTNIYNAKKMAQAVTVGILNSYGVSRYKTTKKINAYSIKGKKVAAVKKNSTCYIDSYAFVNGCLMGHRKKADNYVKVRYLF